MGSSLDLDVGEFGMQLLDNSAALHKLAVRPRKRGSESRNRSPKRDDSDTNLNEDGGKRKKSVADPPPVQTKTQLTYQRTRSGRLTAVDPNARRE